MTIKFELEDEPSIPNFTRKGDDLYLSLDVTSQEASDQASFNINTLDGR